MNIDISLQWVTVAIILIAIVVFLVYRILNRRKKKRCSDCPINQHCKQNKITEKGDD